MRDNLNSHGNAPIMTFNSRDVGHIGIVNIITPKKTHRKPNTQQSPLEPSKPFQSLYASPAEAPMTQLNRFYIPQRIRSDGTDVFLRAKATAFSGFSTVSMSRPPISTSEVLNGSRAKGWAKSMVSCFSSPSTMCE